MGKVSSGVSRLLGQLGKTAVWAFIAAFFRAAFSWIIETFGWGPIIAALVLGGGFSVIVALAEAPWHWVIAIGLMAFAIGLYLAVRAATDLKKQNRLQGKQNLRWRRLELEATREKAGSLTVAVSQISIRDALKIIVQHFAPEWEQERVQGTRDMLAAHRLREAAANGSIEIRGRKEINRDHPMGDRFSNIWTTIGKDYWEAHQFDLAVVLDPKASWQISETQPESPTDAGAAMAPCFAGLRVSEDAVRKLWSEPKPLPRPDYDKWDKAEKFRLIEFAYLWEDAEPGGYQMPPRIQARFGLLHEAIQRGELNIQDRSNLVESLHYAWDKHVVGRPEKADPNWVIYKNDALSYAYSIDEKPPFLFSRERIP